MRARSGQRQQGELTLRAGEHGLTQRARRLGRQEDVPCRVEVDPVARQDALVLVLGVEDAEVVVKGALQIAEDDALFGRDLVGDQGVLPEQLVEGVLSLGPLTDHARCREDDVRARGVEVLDEGVKARLKLPR